MSNWWGIPCCDLWLRKPLLWKIVLAVLNVVMFVTLCLKFDCVIDDVDARCNKRCICCGLVRVASLDRITSIVVAVILERINFDSFRRKIRDGIIIVFINEKTINEISVSIRLNDLYLLEYGRNNNSNDSTKRLVAVMLSSHGQIHPVVVECG